jgi:hypothetical protein
MPSAYATYVEIEPRYPVYYPIFSGSYTKISITLVDQLYRPVELIDKDGMVCTLVISE